MAKKYNYNKEEYRKNQDALKKEIGKQITDITNSWTVDIEKMDDYLKFASRFYKYSFNNTVLIFKQNPEAMYCGSFKFFKDQGYNVKKGEHGMKVFVPVKVTLYRENEDEEWKRLSEASEEDKARIKSGEYESCQALRFKIGTVFDIAQTDCPREDYPKFLNLGYADKTQAQIFEGIKDFSETHLSCPIQIKDLSSLTTRGYYKPYKHTITLNSLLDDSELNSVAAHEIGHALMHNVNEKSKDEKILAQKELEADIMGLLFANHLGLEVSAARKDHLKEMWSSIKTYNETAPEEQKITLDKELNYVEKVFAENVENLTRCINNSLSKDLAISQDNMPENELENPIESYIELMMEHNTEEDFDENVDTDF